MRTTDRIMIVILAVMITSTAFLLCLVLEKSAMADGSTTGAAILEEAVECTPMPEIVVLEAEELDYQPTQLPKPTQTFCAYDWETDMLQVFAKGMYGLDSWNEKYGYVITVVNRYLSGAKNEHGKPLYGSSTLQGIASNKSEYYFYNEDSKVTDENMKLAEFMLNAAFTERFTCYFTGYAFPSSAVLFGFNDDGKPIVRASRDSEPFVINFNWQGVIE